MFFNRAATAPFKDRHDAGQKLAEALKNFKSQRDKVVVLALPRGGVPVAFEVAKSLGAPLDLLMVYSQFFYFLKFFQGSENRCSRT